MGRTTTQARRTLAAVGVIALSAALVPPAAAVEAGTATRTTSTTTSTSTSTTKPGALTGDTQQVSFRGATVTVPASWPVRRLAGKPGCVRFDQHAVYVGDPSRSTCPPHLVGRTSAVHLTTGSLQGVVAPDRVVTSKTSDVGVVVSAGSSPALAQAIASTVTYVDGRADVTAPRGQADARTFASTTGTSSATTSSSPTTTSAKTAAASPSDTTYSGLGFDACTAQPLSTMATWFSASPYKAANMYVGGISRGCAQPNLTADWVTQTIAQGWTLIPTYVGLQASCSAYTNRIDPAQAAAQGAAAADDAIAQLGALGLGLGNPVYFDIEAFDYTNTACLQAAQAFLDAWTVRLHYRGYVSGVYSSSNTMKALLVDKQGDPTFHQPDAIWFARWNGNTATTGDPAIPDQYWANHQRIHQYQGGHQETWGGVTVNIDNNAADAPVAPSQLAADGSFVQVTGSGEVYRMAGGAPIFVSSWDAVGGGPQPVGTLSQSQFDSLPDRPDDGTFLQSGATGRIWRVANGVATYVPSWAPYGGPQPSVVVDQAALDNAGTGGVWNHLSSGRPAPSMRGPAERGTTASKATFSWFGGYSSSVVTSYDVRWRKAPYNGTYGAWTYPATWQRTAVTDVPLGLRAGTTSCVSVRARNKAGQVSAWTGARCIARALDDPSLSRSSGWKAARHKAGFFGGTYVVTTRKGASLSRTGARVKRVGVVASTCPSCGRVAVLLDGRWIGAVDLSGPWRTSTVLMLPAVKLQRATVTLEVRSSGQRVRIDGLVITRS